MNNRITLISRKARNCFSPRLPGFWWNNTGLILWNSLKFNWITLAVLAWLVLNKEFSCQFNFSVAKKSENIESPAVAMPAAQRDDHQVSVPLNLSLFEHQAVKPVVEQAKVAQESNVGNTYKNVTISELTPAMEAEAKRKKQIAYVKRFAKVAQVEMQKYKIPASITLAQGLIESDCGESRLAKMNNNHFGVKCFSKKCNKGHCANFTDDTHKDFFIKYNTAWESYRAHSNLLQGSRYKHLQNLNKTDYKSWAKGLKKAGYATDPNYADKLIRLIEDLQLYRLDRTLE
ncbi:MAG: glucosaminidase domain-containing protein [Saprospiraceae bacterium]|nr:glucosaminidase domain-containing protein [Saprospiraceae bacterium]